VSFRLEDGEAICNGGIETADHSQSMDDVDKPGGFDPSPNKHNLFPLRKTNGWFLVEVNNNPSRKQVEGGVQVTLSLAGWEGLLCLLDRPQEDVPC
jgi:hypothetical protein